MKKLEDISVIYFIGIGGIGMSALARYFRFHGKAVSGYDKTETVLTRALASEGIHIHYDDNLDLAPKNADLVIYTPAIPAAHSELNFYRDNGYELLKRSEVLGLITRSSFNIGVAGTHGKTTITTMVAHLLRDSGYGCNAFLGGISVNYNSNFWSNERNVSVIEADEYDRSFLKLSPDIAVITAMDADHLDIYGDEATMHEAFIQFSGKLKPGGLLITKYGLPKQEQFAAQRHITYCLDNPEADIYATGVRMQNGTYSFTVKMAGWVLQDVILNMGGLHNIENMTAAIAVAHELGIDDEKIKTAVSNFRGVKRRFEYQVKSSELVYVDDYAHHPEELRALISGARGLFPAHHCVLIFQPHLFTRTRDFADDFAHSLDMANETILLPIYPARELPIDGVTSEMLVERMNQQEVKVIEKKELVEYLSQKLAKRSEGDKMLIITAGAGDIDTLVEPVKKMLIECQQ
ncbi:MAG: UDP-N-acetylmuramate--L-alanine ligase [Chitinophagaceae bacterium]|nr:MAG: UDP-N-acetylmuramate--L-alanine ligase [Chitinophagaceae bacterium]